MKRPSVDISDEIVPPVKHAAKRPKIIRPTQQAGGSIFRGVKRKLKRGAKKLGRTAADTLATNAASVASGFAGLAAPSFGKREAGVLPPPVRNILEKQGDTVITSLRAIRTPLDLVTNAALNAITLGAFNKAVKAAGYDKAFHLALVINDKFVLDKQEVIKLTRSIPSGKSTESMPIPLKKSGVTLSVLLDNTREHMGDNRFTNYDARKNNCQDFIIGILEGNGLMPDDQETRDFIKQDAIEIFKKLPKGTAKIARGVTDFAAKADRFIFGRGPDKTPIKDLLNKHSKHHTKKHMNLMEKLIDSGVSFSEAHKRAQEKVGRGEVPASLSTI